jgi:phosphoribosylamine-glycine ligase
MREVIQPVLNGMAADGIPYTGFLYAGLMIKADNTLKVLEFNCRMGDPEPQPIMMRLKSDLVLLLEAAIDGKLDSVQAEWDPRVALGVVLAAANYPEDPRKVARRRRCLQSRALCDGCRRVRGGAPHRPWRLDLVHGLGRMDVPAKSSTS